jgi:hypothetical protein
LCESAASGFNSTRQFIEASEPERVPVNVFKSSEDSAPFRLVGWERKTNSATAPLVELGGDIFGDEVNLCVASNQLLRLGAGNAQGKSKGSAPVRWCNLDPPNARVKPLIHDDPKPKLVDVESQAAFLITHENDDEVQAKIRILAVQTQQGPVHPER